MLIKCDFLSRRRGTISSREETLDKATYPTPGDNMCISKANVICPKVWPINSCLAHIAVLGRIQQILQLLCRKLERTLYFIRNILFSQ